MGPAYLLDVVGVDNRIPCRSGDGRSFLRMKHERQKCWLNRLFELERFGPEKCKSFILTKPDRRGKPKKSFNEENQCFVGPVVNFQSEN